jgi:pimeloyl-ACP methyl ester carboxylesterase
LRRRRRWLIGVAAGLLAVVMLVAYGLRDPSPVGYFTSDQALDRFLAAYDEAMAELPEPDRTIDVRTSYGVVRLYHFAGASPTATPLLLLPGRAAASPVWADNLPSLLRVRSVYTVDLLGEPGQSIQQRPISTPADHAQWLHEVLLDLPEPRIHLFGLSFGGWTAMNLALHRPEKVASVLLLDPVLVFADLPLEVIIRSIPASVRWLPRSWRDDFASWTANGAPVEDVPVARMIEAGMQTYAMKLSAPTRPSREELAGVRPPTLVLLAGESRMHDSAAAAEVARGTLPEGTVIVYPEASHAINGEYPDQIAADVAAFLAGLE